MNMNVSKTNGVKLLAVVAILAMALCVFAAVPADETDAAPSAIPTEIGGGITPSTTSGAYVLQTFTSGEVIVISDFVIPNNTALVVAGTAKFVVNEGVTITIEEGGQLVLSGTADVTINGDIIAEGTDADTDKAGYYGAIINNVKTGAAPSTVGVKVNGNITLERGAEMVFDKTNTIGKDSQIFALSTGVDSGTAAGEIILNEGASLNVTKSSSYISIISTQKVSIAQGATFALNGYAIDVNVVATGSSTTCTAGSMAIDSGFEYADLSKLAGNRDVSNLTFTVSTQNVSAFTTDDADTADRVTLRQYILNVDGTVDGTIVKVSNVDTLYAGKLTIGVETGTPYYAVKEDGTPGTQIQPINSITGTLNVTELGSIEIKGYLSVSGTLAVDYDADTKTGSGNTTAIPKNVTFSTGAYVNVTGTVSINDASNAVTPTAGTIYIDGGSIDLTNVDGGFIATLTTSMQVYGAAYLIEGTGANSEDSLHFRDLSVAVTEGATAGAKEMWVLSLSISANPNTATTVDAAIENGAYVIDEDISSPDGVTLTIEDAIAIADGATLTFEAGSEYDSDADGTTTKCIFVGGKLVDMDGLFERSEGVLKFEVKKLSEDETVATYTTLKIALGEAQPGETIELNDKIVITENLVIPVDVTVVSDTEGIEIQDATLTVNGVLDMDNVDIAFADNVNGNNNGVAEGSVIVNNYIANAGATNFITYDEAGTSIAAANKIAGAHFTGAVDDYDENTTVISTVAIAAAATTDSIVVFGNVSMGDVTFTASADDTLAVYIVNDKDDAKEIARAGTITLSGAVTINTYDGDFTGTVTGADATIALDKNRDMLISVTADESGESVVYRMGIQSENASTTAQWADGTVTIVSGIVTVSDDLTINVVNVDSGATLVIAEGAVLTTGCSDFKTNTIAKELPIVTESLIGNLSGLNIDGTVTVQKTASINAPVSVIDGTVTIEKGAAESTFAIAVISGPRGSKRLIHDPARQRNHHRKRRQRSRHPLRDHRGHQQHWQPLWTHRNHRVPQR